MNNLAATMASDHYLVLHRYLDDGQLLALRHEAEALIDRYYTQAHVLEHSVYPSDSGPTRVSHAMMIAEGSSEFPCVSHQGYPQVATLLQAHNQLIGTLTGTSVEPGSRCLLNYQHYYSGSKPVAEHFDGEYLRTQRSTNGLDFELLEGILPCYVSLLVVSNDNNGKGIELVRDDQVIKPALHAGDMIVFDNIYWRHRVPLLESGRISLGLRNFDHRPWHFTTSEDLFLTNRADYVTVHEGWGSQQADCHSRLTRFFQDEWPAIKASYDSYF